MSVLDVDPSLESRARAVITRRPRAEPDLALLERAALAEASPSPAMLETTAIWLGILDDLRAEGFTDAELLQLGITARTDALTVRVPGDAVLAPLVTPALAEPLLDALRALPTHSPRQRRLAAAALVARGVVEPRDEPLIGLDPAPPLLRAVVALVPPARREALVIGLLGSPTGSLPPRQAVFVAEQVHAIGDLVESPSVAAARDLVLANAANDDQYPRLVERLARPFAPEPRPTAAARRALRHWTDVLAQRAAVRSLGPTAARLWSERVLRVDAPELATVPAWETANPDRRAAIAEGVADALAAHAGAPVRVIDLRAHGGPPIACLECDGLRLCLIPGGTFDRGLSQAEEAAVRALSAANADDNHHEQYDALLETLEALRPVDSVTVGPLLAMQGPGEVVEVADAVTELVASTFRLPSEAEWEYLARGGRVGELTYRGATAPDSREAFRETAAGGEGLANAFRLWGFGIEPEVCADAWAPSHHGAPRDGSPRSGDGPRVVRGGAGQLFPWQDTGEWHLMLSAMRMSQSAWEDAVALRYVLGIRCA